MPLRPTTPQVDGKRALLTSVKSNDRSLLSPQLTRSRATALIFIIDFQAGGTAFIQLGRALHRCSASAQHGPPRRVLGCGFR